MQHSMSALIGAGVAMIVGIASAQAPSPSRTPAAMPRSAVAAAHERLPFFVGESLLYRVRVGRIARVGRTSMIVDTPQTLRGTETWVLRFDFHAKVGLISAVDHTESWLDPVRVTSLRFHKHERHPLSRHDERVELYAGQHRWTAEDGASGDIASDAPLDELSFMYVLRTLPLDADSAVRYERHYDVVRNPTFVRVTGRRTITTEAGTFRTIQVEMRVQDPRRFRGEGIILLDLTDDRCRIPVRIESVMPVVGKTIMTLEHQNHPLAHMIARVDSTR
jgi:hypothetical protein